VQEVDTSYPISVEHFVVRGRHYVVFANKYDFDTDSADSAVSTVFRFDDSSGLLVLHQVFKLTEFTSFETRIDPFEISECCN
jgi:hypothetical protein